MENQAPKLIIEDTKPPEKLYNKEREKARRLRQMKRQSRKRR
jgi:hypothetical protein